MKLEDQMIVPELKIEVEEEMRKEVYFEIALEKSAEVINKFVKNIAPDYEIVIQ